MKYMVDGIDFLQYKIVFIAHPILAQFIHKQLSVFMQSVASECIYTFFRPILDNLHVIR